MSREMFHPIFTIGHSSHEFAAFLKLLQQHGVQAVADVRSSPAAQPQTG